MHPKPHLLIAALVLVVCIGAAMVAFLRDDLRLRAYGHLSRSAFTGDLSGVKALLALGLDPNRRVPGVSPPLVAAAAAGRDEVVQCLLDHGADVNLQDKYGRSALEAAVHSNSLSLTRTLLVHGARVDVMGEEGTPLMVAVQECREPIARVLLEAGANIDLPTPWNHVTARDLARTGGCPAIRQLIETRAPKQSP
jgi:ankyrin repeat protein